MECENCNNYFITEYKINVLEKIIELFINCDKCTHETKFIVEIPTDYMKDKKIVPLHLLKYNYCGPYTNVIKNIVSNIKPYNEIDKQCMIHDLSYHMYKDEYLRSKSDSNLLNYLSNLNKKSISKHIISLVLDIKKKFINKE
ncbi:unknown similar to AMEV101 [Mythimna separata entomopoxvirus 'L']|uniref:Phospholipase A2-like domain-containing protein n=1 Tax=Mythimna separata entomopoxvirus 'L' TaxID=1293572 RepID=A0A916KQE0_9POXV|nr:unknown similar to AMEV101 [Mythimna separata entomopoxvirus 'L']CCU56325.1 unknown similar to AMEV101 [Mythimna separata entomopoxvirus 'L']